MSQPLGSRVPMTFGAKRKGVVSLMQTNAGTLVPSIPDMCALCYVELADRFTPSNSYGSATAFSSRLTAA